MNDEALRHELERTKRFLNLVLETGRMNGAYVDTDLRHTWVHNAAPEPPEEEILGKTDEDLFPAEAARPTTELKREAIETGSHVEQEFTFVKPWGQNRYRAGAEPIYDRDGDVEGAMFAAVELSDRNRFLERTTDAVYSVDSDWEVTFWNERMAERTGIDADEVVGTTLWETFGESIPTNLEGEYRRVMETGEPAEFERYLPEPYDYWVEVRVFPDEEGLSVFSRDITERKRRENRLRSLHDATRKMMHRTDRESICDIAVDTAGDLLDLPASAIWLRADDDSGLEPVGWSPQAESLFGELPWVDPGTSIFWEVYEANEPRVYDDLRDVDVDPTADSGVQSVLVVPIQGYGVLTSISTDSDRFGENAVSLAQLLTANTRAALERAEREATLEHRTDQMEFFNSILRHDVLNGMTVIRSRAEFLTESVEGQDHRDAETILKWSDEVTDIVQRVRQTLDTLTGRGDIERRPVSLSETVREEVDRLAQTYPAVTFDTSVPVDCHVLATELLGEVLGNVVSNAIQHNDTEGLHVSVTATEREDTVVVRVADDGTGVPDEEKEAIFRRDETGHAKSSGSGFGLFFVDVMVGEFGGDVWVEDNELGGATFCIELPLTEPPASATTGRPEGSR